MTEKKNGTVVRDITTTVTETGQMYVTIPVPASVKAAIKPTHQPPNWTLTAQPGGGGGFGGRGGGRLRRRLQPSRRGALMGSRT